MTLDVTSQPLSNCSFMETPVHKISLLMDKAVGTWWNVLIHEKIAPLRLAWRVEDHTRNNVMIEIYTDIREGVDSFLRLNG